MRTVTITIMCFNVYIFLIKLIILILILILIDGSKCKSNLFKLVLVYNLQNIRVAILIPPQPTNFTKSEKSVTKSTVIKKKWNIQVKYKILK